MGLKHRSLHLGSSSSKVTHITMGVTTGLLTIVGIAVTAVLVSRFRTQTNSGEWVHLTLSRCGFCHCYDSLDLCSMSYEGQLFLSSARASVLLAVTKCGTNFLKKLLLHGINFRFNQSRVLLPITN